MKSVSAFVPGEHQGDLRAASAHRPADLLLVRSARRGSAWAKQELFRRHTSRCYGFARRLGVEADELADVIQESFAVALERFDTLRNPAQFSIWLSHVVLSTAHRAQRRRRLRERIGDLPGAETSLDEVPAPWLEPDPALRGWSLKHALLRLSEKERDVLFLRRIELATVEEIAGLLGMSASTVKRRVARAQASLGKALQQGFRPKPPARRTHQNATND